MAAVARVEWEAEVPAEWAVEAPVDGRPHHQEEVSAAGVVDADAAAPDA